MSTRRSVVFVGTSALLLSLCASDPALAGPPPGFVDASTFGYNTTDATAALQAAIETGQNVWVPKKSDAWHITGIDLDQSNQEILFESGVTIAAKQGAFLGANDRLFTAKNVSNVTLSGYGATFQMRKSDYTQAPYQQGEWRHGIGLYSVSNFQIKGMTIRDTGGDGIYVGDATTSGYCQDVTIQDVTLKTNYRNGISVISANGLTIDNVKIWKTGIGTGTAPKDGIDFEPNHAAEILKNITVKNSIFSTNAIDGVNFSTKKNPNANIDNVVLTHNTFYNNRARGLVLQVPEPGITIKNSLFVRNHQYGVEEKYNSDNPAQSIDYSAFWANTKGTIISVDPDGDDLVVLGPGSLTNVPVAFYSTAVDSPYYMYLAANTSSLITHGADDGTYMGARPAYGDDANFFAAVAPEPSTISLLSVAAILLMWRRKEKSTC